VDYGVDAVTAQRNGFRDEMRYSTEILYRRSRAAFTDGDILKIGNGIDIPDHDLSDPFEPRVDFVGTDALYTSFEVPPPHPFPGHSVYLPLISASTRH
jgi:hypothetical protein